MRPKHIQCKRDSIQNDGAFIEAIPAVVFAVIIAYVYLNVGTFMTGTLGSELTEYFGDDVTPWNTTVYWANGTFGNAGWVTGDTNSSSRNQSLVVPLTSMEQTTTLFRITANRTEAGLGTVNFHLYANNVLITNRSLIGGGHHAYNATLSAISSNITTSVYYLNWSWRVNDTDNSIYTIYDYNRAADYKTTLENKSVNTMENISGNFDDNVDIIKIAITISVLLIPIMAIMTMRRFI